MVTYQVGDAAMLFKWANRTLDEVSIHNYWTEEPTVYITYTARTGTVCLL